MRIPPVFGTLVFVYGGWVFIQGSAVVTFGYPGTPLGEESSTLVSVMLLGH